MQFIFNSIFRGLVGVAFLSSLVAFSALEVWALEDDGCGPLIGEDSSNPLQGNPFLQSIDNAYDLPDFPSIKTEHFLPAMTHLMEKTRGKQNRIAEDHRAPTFENTILPLESYEEDLDVVFSTFHWYLQIKNTKELRTIEKEVKHLAEALDSELKFDKRIFARIKALYRERNNGEYDPAQVRLIERYYDVFVKSGANLSKGDQQKLRGIKQELLSKTTDFENNEMDAIEAMEFVILDEAKLKGIPESLVEQAKKRAESKGQRGWIFSGAQMETFLIVQNAEDGGVRKEVFYGSLKLASGGEFDNGGLVKEIVALRHKRAQLLGYPTHAHFQLERRMARNPETVNAFLNTLADNAYPRAKAEVEKLRAFALEQSGREMDRCDVLYWSKKLQEKELGYEPESLRKYFPLERVVKGAFELASRLYGFEFTEIANLPKYDSSQRYIEVRRKGSNKVIGLIPWDVFRRLGEKRGGAWVWPYRPQSYKDGERVPPVATLSTNFTPAVDGNKVLLNHSEVKTFFHEFGHVIDKLVKDTPYASLQDLPWDAIEIPSQFLENYTYTKEGLDLFALDEETGQKIPEEIVEKLVSSREFMSGRMVLAGVLQGMVDMAWHSSEEGLGPVSIEEYEIAVTEDFDVFPPIPGYGRSYTFSHIFAGGYSAGYYTYLWSEAHSADAFSLFEEEGLFSSASAQGFERFMAQGSTRETQQTWKEFRGRELSMDAFYRTMGFDGVGVH